MWGGVFLFFLKNEKYLFTIIKSTINFFNSYLFKMGINEF